MDDDENNKQKPVTEPTLSMPDECGDSLWDAVLDQYEEHPIQTFGAIAFTPEVKALQEKYGSRANYKRVESKRAVDGLTENEIYFIGQRDSFYMASYSDNNYPYIQHRGGPKGFTKILDKKRIGFLDFSGNKQYISTGNFKTNNHVALIMVDYPARARLKIFATAEIIGLSDNPALLEQLALENYRYNAERMMILHIEAYDWNCPQHITPRYTIDQIEEALAAQRLRIQQLEEEVKRLKAVK